MNFCDFIKILAHFSKFSIKNVGSFWLELNFLWLVLARAKYFCKPTLARLEPEFLTKGTGSARLELGFFWLVPPLVRTSFIAVFNREQLESEDQGM